MSGERLFGSLAAKPAAHCDIAAIIAPVVVAAVLTPPRIRPVCVDAHHPAEPHLGADARYQQQVIEPVGLKRNVKRSA